MEDLSEIEGHEREERESERELTAAGTRKNKAFWMILLYLLNYQKRKRKRKADTTQHDVCAFLVCRRSLAIKLPSDLSLTQVRLAE